MSSTLHAKDALIWGFSPFPPFLYLNDEGKPSGKYASMIDNLFEKAELTYSIVPAPNRRSRQLIFQGKINFGIAPKSIFENPNDYIFSDFPVAEIKAHVFWRTGTPPVASKEELVGKTRIIISSYSYGEIRETLLNNRSTLNIEVEDHQRGVLALTRNRADYLIGYYAPTQQAIRDLKIADLPNQYLNATQMYLVIHKSVENGQQLKGKLQNAYRELYGQHPCCPVGNEQ